MIINLNKYQIEQIEHALKVAIANSPSEYEQRDMRMLIAHLTREQTGHKRRWHEHRRTCNKLRLEILQLTSDLGAMESGIHMARRMEG